MRIITRSRLTIIITDYFDSSHGYSEQKAKYNFLLGLRKTNGKLIVEAWYA